MNRADSLYDACGALFAGYPLAVRVVDWRGTMRSMVLLLRDDDDAGFFVLTHDCSEGRPFYSLSSWHAGEVVDIEADGDAVPDVAVSAVARGIPIPRHGSLFGWRRRKAVTALIPTYAKYTPACPEPAWAVMPLAGTPEAQWPPFISEHLLGCWFWDHYRAGSLVSLGDLIAGTPDTVFWVDTQAILGGNCCVVARDIGSQEGYTLRRGPYVYYETLRAGKPVPPPDVLLSDPGKTDLAPRFRRSGDAGLDPAW